MKKGFLDISFSWIFALIVGALILFLAIYFVTQFGEVRNTQSSAETGTSFLNSLIPLETGSDSSRSTEITFPVNTRINHFCEEGGTFGRERISLQEFIRNRWTDSGVNLSSEDKYLFFPETIEGKDFFLFSKSFQFPFKIGNLIYVLNSDEVYCFRNAPNEIENELKSFNYPNFKFDNCQFTEVTRVCFSSEEDCDIEVNLNLRTVEKGNDLVYFEGNSLLYGAIFSDEEIYECEVQRLMKRGIKLTEIYQEKSLMLGQVGCDSALSTEFSGLRNLFNLVSGSENLYTLKESVRSINDINRFSRCTLW